MRKTRPRIQLWHICLTVALALWTVGATAQSVGVRLDGDQLRIIAPQLHFLGEEALRRLHNGIAVNYMIRFGIGPERNVKPDIEVTYRFVISYDIFEEKFAVNRLSPNPRSITHLTEASAQAWCLDSIGLPATSLSSDKPYWSLLEYRLEETASAADSNPSIIGQLVDAFSRTRQKQEFRGSLVNGPFRLSELRRAR